MKVCSSLEYFFFRFTDACMIDSAKLHLHWNHEICTHIVTILLRRQKERWSHCWFVGSEAFSRSLLTLGAKPLLQCDIPSTYFFYLMTCPRLYCTPLTPLLP